MEASLDQRPTLSFHAVLKGNAGGLGLDFFKLAQRGVGRYAKRQVIVR